MGFCDPCPGEPKQLLVEYMFSGQKYRVFVDMPVSLSQWILISEVCNDSPVIS